MNKKLAVKISCIILALGVSLAYAADVKNGEKLFSDPGFGGGTTGKTCKACHEGGEMLDPDLFDREEYVILGKKGSSPADLINICIENPLGGKAIDPEGKEMTDLLAYLKTLIGIDEENKKKKKAFEGC